MAYIYLEEKEKIIKKQSKTENLQKQPKLENTQKQPKLAENKRKGISRKEEEYER